MKKYIISIILLTSTLCSAEEVTYQKIDDTHVRKTTNLDPKIEVIDIGELKNKETDITANIEYKTLTCGTDLTDLEKKSLAIKKDIDKAKEVGVESSVEVNP